MKKMNKKMTVGDKVDELVVTVNKLAQTIHVGTDQKLKMWVENINNNIDEKLEKLAVMVNNGFRDQEKRMDERFDQVDQRLDGVESRLTSVERKLWQVELNS